MPNVSKKMYWGANSSAAVTGVTTTFTTTKKMTMVMNTPKLQNGNPQPHRGWMDSVRLIFSNAGTSTTCSFKLCSDAAGNYAVIQSTTLILMPGVTTNTIKTATGTIDIPVQNTNADATLVDTYWLFVLVNAGTPTLESAEFGWSE